MKKILRFFTGFVAAILLTIGVAFSQSNPDMHNKTYYDAEKTKMKEVYALREETQLDPSNPANSKMTYLKHGPYFFYYESGKLKISGQYKDDQKSGEWKYYDEAGKLIKTEKYQNGQLVP